MSDPVTWTDLGHPELEGAPILATIAGPLQVPPYPPVPGPRIVGGLVEGDRRR